MTKRPHLTTSSFATMPSNNDSHVSIGGVNNGDEYSPSSLTNDFDAATLAPSSSSMKSTNDTHFANATVEDFVDLLPNIFLFLDENDDKMHARVVCTTWRDAAEKALMEKARINEKEGRGPFRGMSEKDKIATKKQILAFREMQFQ